MIESTESNLIDFLLDGRNPYHRGVALLLHHTFGVITSRVVEIDHAGLRGFHMAGPSMEERSP